MSDERIARLIAGTLCMLSLVWAAAVPLSARVRSSAHTDSIVARLAAIPHGVGRFICHQRPDRSFMSGAVQWPVCGRCSGLYLSAAVAIAAIALGGRGLLASPLSAPRAWRVTLSIAALPTLVSWVLERAAWWVPTSTARAWMAAPLGAAVGALVASVMVQRENACKNLR